MFQKEACISLNNLLNQNKKKPKSCTNNMALFNTNWKELPSDNGDEKNEQELMNNR